MGFKRNCYAKVWDIYPPKEGKKTCRVRLSVSKKNKNGDGYITDFSDYCTFIGSAFTYATTKLMKGDRIKLTEIDVSSTYNKEKDKQYIDFKVFECEPADSGYTSSRSEAEYPFDSDQEDLEMTAAETNGEDSEDLPF